MYFFYDAWGSGDIVVNVMQALAVIAASNELKAAMLAAAMLGFLFLIFNAALNVKSEVIVQPFKLIITFVLILGIMLVPTNMIIDDKFRSQDILWKPVNIDGGIKVINNVPLGVALPATFASTLGSTLTKIIETALGNVKAPDQLSSAGLWLSARTLKQMLSDDQITDATLITDFKYFLENCTYFDILAKRVSLNNLKNVNITKELAKTKGGLTSLHVNENSSEIVAVSCDKAWGGSNNPNVKGLKQRIKEEGLVKKFKACQHLRGISMAMTAYRRHHESAIGKNPKAGQAKNCGDSVFTHTLATFGFKGFVTDKFSELVAINLMKNSSYLLSQQDPLSLEFASFVGNRQRNSTYVIAGELAATALPALRGLLEAVVLVLLPVLLILGFILFERMSAYLKNGLILVLWLHLWPPIMSVINNIGQWLQKAAINKHIIINQGNFTLSSVENMLNDLDIQMALARYMLVLVPMIAWALVRSGEIGGAMIASRLLGPGESAASSVSSNVATNNWSMDQVNLEPRTTVGPHIGTIGDSWGGRVTQHDNLDTMILPSNQPGYIEASQSRSITQAISRHAETASSEAQEYKNQFSKSVETAYESAYGKQGVEALNTLRESGVSDQTSFKALEGTNESIRQAVTKSRAVGQDESTNYDASFNLHTGVDPFKMFSLPIVVSGTTDLTQSHGANLHESLQRSYSQLSDESKSAMQEVSDVLTSSEQISSTASYENITSESHRANMQKASSELETYSESQQYANKLSLASQQAQTTGQSVIREFTKDPLNTKLLLEFHDLYHAQNMEFDQAWKLAQERSGINLDIDAISERLLNTDVQSPVMPAVDPYAIPKAHRENVQEVDNEFNATPDIGLTQTATKVEIERKRGEIELHEFKGDTSEHYNEDKTIDRKVKDRDGNEFVVPEKGKLYDNVTNRQKFITEEFFHLAEDHNKKNEKEKDD